MGARNCEIRNPGKRNPKRVCVEPWLDVKSLLKEGYLYLLGSIYLWPKIIDDQLKIRG